jgi:putative transposase
MHKVVSTVVRIHRFPALSKAMLARISAGRGEAANVWRTCRDLHQEARETRTDWPSRNDLQKATKNRFGLHSQSAQMVCHAFLANSDSIQQLRKQGHREMRYPWKDKRYYPLLWPEQAVAVQGQFIVLPMGRGRASIVLPKPEGFVAGGCKLVWNGAENELHVSVETLIDAPVVSDVVATIDLGQIHQCAVTTNTGQALIVSGRGQRSLKRRMNPMHGQVARLQSRCTKGSRRWKKLARSRHKHAGRIERQVRDLAHKGTRAVADFCKANEVSRVFVGDPNGVRRQSRGRKHNQRMAQWEYGRDKTYLEQKLSRLGISSFTGTERGTSSRCPMCGHKHKPKGRVWACKSCGFKGHRDLVGSANMHEDNFEKLTTFPSLKDVTYLRPGLVSMRHATRMKTSWRGSSSRPDTGHGEGASPFTPALLSEPLLDTTCQTDNSSSRSASLEAGHRHRLSTEAHPL